MAKGFAAFLRFMKPVEHTDGKWFGELKGKRFEIQDDKAGIFAKLRKEPGFPDSVFSSTELWDGLVFSEGFRKAVTDEFALLQQEG